MLANVFTKNLRDRWVGVTIGSVTIALFLLYAMSVYRDVDLSIYTDLPVAIRDLFGIPDTMDVSGLAYGAMYGFMGAMTLAALAISMGAASIAGEERNGTIGILLGNPRSRTEILAAKAEGIIVLVAAGTLVMWLAAVAVPAVLDVDVSGLHVGALMIHTYVNALFYGFLAVAIGSWTGNATAASGGSVGVMVLGYLGSGLLPLIDSVSGLARIFPWYYYDASATVSEGLPWGDFLVLSGATAALAALAVVGVNRRDLKEKSVARTILDRLRDNPRTRKYIDRIAGSARVSSMWTKTLSDHQGLVIVVSYIMALTAIGVGPMFPLIDEGLKSFSEALPDALIAMVGGADMGTAAGFLQTEIFSLMAPVATIVVAAGIGAKALAGEEARRTMGLLLANPIPRSRVVTEKAVAMVIHTFLVVIATFAGTAIGSLLGGLGIDLGHAASTSVLSGLLGLVFGSLALALSAGTGRVKVAAYGAAGAALVSYLVNSFAPLTEAAAGIARWTPFNYYLTTDPLNNGMDWGDASVLVVLSLGLMGLSFWLFQRRDLRQSG